MGVCAQAARLCCGDVVDHPARLELNLRSGWRWHFFVWIVSHSLACGCEVRHRPWSLHRMSYKFLRKKIFCFAVEGLLVSVIEAV